MPRNLQPAQPSMQRFPLEKFSQAVTQPGTEKTAVPWTHRTDKDLYWTIDDDHFSSGQPAQGKIMKVVRGNETLMFLALEDAIRRCNGIISMNSSQGVGLQQSQYPLIAMYQGTRIAFRYNIDNGQIRRLQMRMKNEADFDGAMATLRSLECPLQGSGARDGPRSSDGVRRGAVSARRTSVQPGTLPIYQSSHGQVYSQPGPPQQPEPQGYPQPVGNLGGYPRPGGGYDANRTSQPDTAFGSLGSTHSFEKHPEGRPYTSPQDLRRPSTELMPPPQDLPLQATLGNQSTTPRPRSSSPTKHPAYSSGVAVPSRHIAEPMDIERPSFRRDSMLNLPPDTPPLAPTNQDPDYRPFTGISDRTIKTSGSNARGPLHSDQDVGNTRANPMPLNTAKDSGLNAMAGNRPNNDAAPEPRPRSSSMKPFAPDAGPGIPFEESRLSLQQFGALSEVEQARQLDSSLRHWIHDDKFLTLCEVFEKSPELRFRVESAVEEMKDRNLGRGSFR